MIRLGTWNLDHAPRKRVSALSDVLRRNPSDIWILTETRDVVRPDEDMVAVHSPPRPNDSIKVRDDSRWVSIWSRYPILQTFELSADPTRTVAARIELPMQRHLLVYGTVLPWNADQVHRGAERRQSAVGAQIDEWSTLKSQFRDDWFVLAGDFNQDMGGGGPGSSKRVIRQLNDAFASLGLSCITSPERLRNQNWSHSLIDHIAVSEEIASAFRLAHTWRPDPSSLSDHGGVVMSAPFGAALA